MADPSAERFPWAFVALLSLAQLISWGSIFYAFALFMEPMSRELGWSKPALTAAYSLGLAASGVAAVPVGRLIDLGYGRAVMTAGSLAAAALLAAWSTIASYPAFLLLWLGLGAAMSAVLYDPGFAVLIRRLGARARRGVTVMTLVGGLASTVFLPLAHLLIEGFGWRSALLGLAAANLGVCAVIHGLVIPPQGPKPAAGARPAQRTGAARVLRKPAFWGFVATVLLQGVLATGFAIHLIPLLVERGFSLDAAVAAFAVIGPAQVAARLAFALGERVLGLKAVGLLSLALWVLAFALLPFVPAGSWLVVVFAALYGASNGLMTIVRALLPPELFGREDYGTIQGLIAAPSTFARAAAPFAFGALWAWSGSYDLLLGLAVAMAVASLAAYALTLASAGAPPPSE
ncbi:MAG TPA: MFS transporter [Microvirga sp.]|nr:MFS transporter [Microvirga sp.]